MKHFLFVSVFQQSLKCLLPVLLLSFFIAPAQVFNDYGFERQNIVPVHDINNVLLLYPWAGGLNSCQFSSIDLNQDGKEDLFVFDKMGNRIITFLNNGTTTQPYYTFDWTWAAKFPVMTDWVRLVDYNCDGKKDIFCYGYGGITVYKNTSTSTGGLSFQWISNQILSYQFGGYSNIYTASVDYPAVADMDGDGDLDVMTFWILGGYINFHKNLSMEKYGVCDSLDYQMTAFCWGNVKENDSNNVISTNVACPFKLCSGPVEPPIVDPDAVEHTGSTLTAFDFNNDSVQDVLVGDVTYPGIIGMINTGTKTVGHIGSTIQQYPAGTRPIDLSSFPCTDYLDVDNDGKKDLIVSPFESGTNMAENLRSVWLYKNTGTTQSPVFNFVKRNFLQDEMIEVGSSAMPLLYDVDQDGLTDLLIGSEGQFDTSFIQAGFLHTDFHSQLYYYKNTGTATDPAFTLVDTNYAGVKALNILYTFPTMGDIDGDGDPDLFIGKKDGHLVFFKNHAGPGNPPAYDAPVIDYMGIDVGDNSAPQLFDIDHDNLLDLLIGNRKGNVVYYRNIGSATNPVFSHITDTLGSVNVVNPNVSNYGFTKPCFFRTPANETRLFAGSIGNGINYYKNIDGNLAGQFTLVAKNYLSLQDGQDNAPAMANLDGDTYPDLLLGNGCGGVAYYKGAMPGPTAIVDPGDKWNTTFTIYPNPGRDLFSIQWDSPAFKGLLNVSVTDLSGRIMLIKPSFDPNAEKLDLSGWESGLYFVSCRDNRQSGNSLPVQTRKLVMIQ